MKRSYNGQPYQPPLPPGQPPPPPSAAAPPPPPPHNPYPAYGYASYAQPPVPAQALQPAAHPQYPGYGYGGVTPAASATSPSPYAPYGGSPSPYPQPTQAQTYPQQPAYPYGTPSAQPNPYPQQGYMPVPQIQQQQYAQAYAPGQQPQQQQQQQHQPIYTSMQGYGPPPVQHPSQAPPPPPPHYTGSPVAGLMIGPVQGSPGAPPPFKRTRYDGLAQGPPAALHPIGPATNHDPRDSNSRGGFRNDRGGGGGRGGPSRDYRGDSPSHSLDGYAESYHSSAGGGGGRRDFSGASSSYGGSNSSYRGRGNSSYEARGGVRGGGSGLSRGGGNSRDMSYRDSSYSGRGSERGGRGKGGGGYDRARPVSALPGSGRAGQERAGGREDKTGSKKSSTAGGIDSLPKAPRAIREGVPNVRLKPTKSEKKNMKWSSDRDGIPLNALAREDAKKTLTDFRIGGLAISEIDWDWKADPILAVIASIVEESDPWGSSDEKNDDGVDEKVQEVDMSFEFTNLTASDPRAVETEIKAEGTEVEKPKKKLSKSQKKAAKRATALELIKNEKEAQEKIAAEAIEVDVKIEEEVKEEVQKESSLIQPIIEEVKKDGKHGRDEEDGDESRDAEDIAATKKVKADTGEIVTLSTADLSTPAPPAPRQSTPTGPSSLVQTSDSIPTGPRATATTPAPPLDSAPHGRENSRLRIYFASPIVPLPPPEVEKALSSNLIREVPKEMENKEVVVKEDEEKEKKSESAVERNEGNEDEDIDGVEVADDVDVDGVELDGGSLAEPSEGSQNEAESNQVLASLLAARSATPKREEQDAPIVVDTTDSTPLAAPLETDDSLEVVIPVDVSTNARGSEVDPNEGKDDSLLPTEVVQLPIPSADRISISYAKNTRRIVLDARVVETVKIFRAERKIELLVSIKPAMTGEGDSAVMDEYRTCQGVLIESLDLDSDEYVIVDRHALANAWKADSESIESSASTLDHLLPPLHRLLEQFSESTDGLRISPGVNKDQITIIAYLDRSNPLTEARWVKTGDVEAWINQLGLSSDVNTEWKGKIIVTDPDPPPTIQHALETWANSATLGTLAERSSFVADHLSANIDNCFEILLRLTRGDRSVPSHYAQPSQAASVGVLAATLQAPYAEHQTQVSLAVLAMFRLSVETAVKAGIGKEEVERQVAEIVRGIPYHLIFKSLDGMWREFRGKNKSSGTSSRGGGGGAGSATKRP